MTLRVAGCMKGSELDARLAGERKYLAAFNQMIDTDFGQCVRGLSMRSHANGVAEVCFEGVDTAHMIRMQMRQNYLPHSATFGNQVINASSESHLLVFIRRSRIEDENFPRAVNQVTVCMGCRRPRWGAYWETDVVG